MVSGSGGRRAVEMTACANGEAAVADVARFSATRAPPGGARDAAAPAVGESGSACRRGRVTACARRCARVIAEEAGEAAPLRAGAQVRRQRCVSRRSAPAARTDPAPGCTTLFAFLTPSASQAARSTRRPRWWRTRWCTWPVCRSASAPRTSCWRKRMPACRRFVARLFRARYAWSRRAGRPGRTALLHSCARRSAMIGMRYAR